MGTMEPEAVDALREQQYRTALSQGGAAWAPEMPTLNGEASPGTMEAGVTVSAAEALPAINPFYSDHAKPEIQAS